MKRGPRPRPIEERFWSKVHKTDTCWVWIGGLNPQGYGRLSTGHSSYKSAHRVAYELLVGPIPVGLDLDHLCRVPACVNPSHLEAVTHKVNCLRGISPFADKARRTHCVNGHEYTPENTKHRRAQGDMRRDCKTCDRERQQRYRARKQLSA